MSIKKNIISNLVLTGSTILFPLIILPYVSRTLSVKNLGNVFYIDSFTQYFILFSAIGIPYYGVREIAKLRHDKEKISKLVSELVIIQSCLSILFCGIFITTGFVINNDAFNNNLVYIGCLTILSNSFLIEWFYQGIQNFSYITIRSLIVKLLTVIMILFFVKTKNDFQVYYFITAIGIFLNSVVNFVYFIKNHYTPFTFKKSILNHLKPLILLFSISVAISLYTLMDTVILGSLTDSIQVSLYNIPLKISKIFWSIMGGIGMVMLPKLSSLHTDNNQIELMQLMQKSINIVFILGIPFWVICLLFPNDILYLVTGKQYLDSAIALQILGSTPIIIGLCNVFGTQYLLVIGEEKKILIATIYGLTISLFFNLTLIPKFGFYGSSIAYILAELTVCIFIYKSSRKFIKVDIDYNLLKLLLSSSLVTVLLWFWLSANFSHWYLMIIVLSLYFISFSLLNHLIFKNCFVKKVIKIIIP